MFMIVLYLTPFTNLFVISRGSVTAYIYAFHEFPFPVQVNGERQATCNVFSKQQSRIPCFLSYFRVWLFDSFKQDIT